MRRFLYSCLLGTIVTFFLAEPATPETAYKHYYAHDAVLDRYGVIAPWYQGQNGQFDYRVRIAAETLKRYPWVDKNRAVAPGPEFIYNGKWSIDADGKITIGLAHVSVEQSGRDDAAPTDTEFRNGDLGDRAAFVLRGMIDYYAYSGDPASFAIVSTTANYLVDHCQTAADHPWPKFLISVPDMGVRYRDCRLGPSDAQIDKNGKMQLDFVAEVGIQLIRAYELEGNPRWYQAAKHWGDLLAERRRHDPAQSPWGRYADNRDRGMNGVQTGGEVLILMFFDELIRTGYRGQNDEIVHARDAGRDYFRNVLLPAWWVDDTFGRSYWDWVQPNQAENITDFVAVYLMQNQAIFPHWKENVRDILSLFLNHTSVEPIGASDTFNGAWAYPESSTCCDRSLWYPAMELAPDFARYGVQADDAWGREVGRRSQMLATYDPLDTGESQDLIQGGSRVCKNWFKIAQPMALEHVLETMAWLPEIMGANRENHIMRTSGLVRRVIYGKDEIAYSTFDAEPDSVDVLRLAYRPTSVTANGKPLDLRSDLGAPGYTVSALTGGDFIVSIRHDGYTQIIVKGNDPQVVVDDKEIHFEGNWSSSPDLDDWGKGSHVAGDDGATMISTFTGNQVRLVGRVGQSGGMARVYVDDIQQLVPVDCYSPVTLHQQILYYKNGLSNGPHSLKIVVSGERRPLSAGSNVYVDAVQSSTATGNSGFGAGGGPTGFQRMIFGYTKPTDFIDSKGNAWHPGTEFIERSGMMSDSVAKSWWTMPQTLLLNNVDISWSSPLVSDPELYRYGVHAPDFTVNTTVGPGTYHVTLKFAETDCTGPNQRGITVFINGKKTLDKLDVYATAGGSSNVADIVLNDIHPEDGIIAIRFVGSVIDGNHRDAMVQAIEVGPGQGTGGMEPKSVNFSGSQQASH